MALSEKAEARKEAIKNWITNQLKSDCFDLYSVTLGRGVIGLKRIWMIGGLALSLEYGDPKAHVLENDEHWKIIDRELSILAPVFYDHVADEQWQDISSARHSKSMHSHFYRSKIRPSSSHTFIHPELVAGFPTFPGGDIAVGSLQAIYPQDAVFKWLGKIGGVSTRQLEGLLGLSNDVATQLVIKIGTQTNVANLKPPTLRLNIPYEGPAANVNIVATPNDPSAKAEHLENGVYFPNDGTQVDLRVKIIAEDDTEYTYTVQVTDHQG